MKKTSLIACLSATILATSASSALAAEGNDTVRIRKVGNTLWKEGPLDATAVDWSLFPKSYGILANERLMYPVDVSDWPLKIGPHRQLFVDNYLIAQAAAVSRTVHQPVRYAGNPIMEETEGEHNVIVLKVLRDPETGKFRMWYKIQIWFTFPGTQIQGQMPALYAESEDGIHWIRRRLGVLEHNGSKDNNWVTYGPLGMIHYPGAEGHPVAEDPERRYLATVYHWPPYVKAEGKYLYASPDGLRWTRLREQPVMTMMDGGTHFPLEGLGDASKIRYDPLLGRYVGDIKILFKPTFRTRGFMTSQDLVHWTRPRMTIYPDALDAADAQLYAHNSFIYEGMWLSMLRVLQYARADRKQTDIELSCSRDGLHWSRVGNREIFFPQGGEDSWERDYTSANTPILVDDELWFYYRGSRHTGVKGKFKTFVAKIGLAKLRRDGFVSIDAADQPGKLITRPLTFVGRKLHLNTRVKEGGWIRVAALDVDGEPIAGYTLDESRPVVGDSTDTMVSWEGTSDVSAALGSREHLRLRFEIKNAELYAFWIE